MRPVRDVPRITGFNLRALAFVCGPQGSRNVDTFGPTTQKGATDMSTTAIVLIIVAVIVVLGAVAFVARRQRARQLDQKRLEAREHREQADTRDRKAEQARLAAEEQADRARKEQTAAEEHRQQAEKIDPDVEE
jgi:C4-dicarboxylate-specific signal transduction histidine kinase